MIGVIGVIGVIERAGEMGGMIMMRRALAAETMERAGEIGIETIRMRRARATGMMGKVGAAGTGMMGKVGAAGTGMVIIKLSVLPKLISQSERVGASTG